MPDDNRLLLWIFSFLLILWIGGTLALTYMDYRLKMASRNMAGVAEMAAALHKARETGENRR